MLLFSINPLYTFNETIHYMATLIIGSEMHAKCFAQDLTCSRCSVNRASLDLFIWFEGSSVFWILWALLLYLTILNTSFLPWFQFLFPISASSFLFCLGFLSKGKISPAISSPLCELSYLSGHSFPSLSKKREIRLYSDS